MVVPLGQVQVKAETHQHRCADDLGRYGLLEQCDPQCGADERRGGEIGARARGAPRAARPKRTEPG